MPDLQTLYSLYAAFNAHDIEAIIAMMHPLVAWASDTHGGYVHGRESVREYWNAQFMILDPKMDPVSFNMDDSGRAVFDVRQVFHDLDGHLLMDKTVKHIFSFDNGLIKKFEIGG